MNESLSKTADAAIFAPIAPGVIGPALTLAKRELVRFLRQRNRVARGCDRLPPQLILWRFGGHRCHKLFVRRKLCDGFGNHGSEYQCVMPLQGMRTLLRRCKKYH